MSRFTTLVDCETLATHLQDPDWVIVDCRFRLTDCEAGRVAYAEGHLPGAVYADLDQDLSSPVTAHSGRHPLPEPDSLAARCRGWGIGTRSQVVVYDDAGGAVAARLWWLLRWLGHDFVALLDGGIPAWRAAHLALEQRLPEPRSGDLVANINNKMWIETDKLLDETTRSHLLLVDARSAARFRGEQEPIDPVAGHIPGAVSFPLERNLDPDGRFRSPDELQTLWQVRLGSTPATSVVHSCGSGVSACHNLLAMEVAGFSGSLLYPGSWSEWIRDPARPVTLGA